MEKSLYASPETAIYWDKRDCADWAAVIKVSEPAGKKGDANSDGKVNVADAVAVLQYIANKEKYPLTDEERENADCDGVAGITGGDAIAIQKADAGILDLNKV